MDDFQVIGLHKVAATNKEIASNMATIFGSHGQQDLNLNGNSDKLAPQKSRKHLQGQPYPARYFVSLSSASPRVHTIITCHFLYEKSIKTYPH